MQALRHEWVFQPPRLAYADPSRARSDFDADLQTIDGLIEGEEATFRARMKRSIAMGREAEASLAGGVASNWQAARPAPVWIDRVRAPHVWDVDGAEYVDMHGGFGATLVGHAHPAIVRAVTAQVQRGTHFSQPTNDLIPVTRNLADRFGLPLWRFTSTGTRGDARRGSPDARVTRSDAGSSRSKGAITATMTACRCPSIRDARRPAIRGGRTASPQVRSFRRSSRISRWSFRSATSTPSRGR